MRLQALTGFSLALFAIFVGSQSVSAKINVNLQTYYSEELSGAIVEQWDATTGTKVLRYTVIDGFGGTPESVDAIAMKSTGRLYASLNNLGYMDIIRLNTNTGLTIVPPDYCDCGIGVPFANYFGGGSHLLFDAHNDIFADGVSGVAFPPADRAVIYRFDGQTGAPKGEVVLDESRFVSGVDTFPNGEFLFVMHYPTTLGPGIDPNPSLTKYSYSPMSNVFTEVASYPVGTNLGDLTIGPGGTLYVSDFTADAVLTYDADGNFLGQFMDEYVDDFEWIEGKLIGLTGDSRVVEINKLDGSIVGTLVDASTYAGPGTLSFFGMAAFSVPEPSAICLSLVCLLPLLGVSRLRTLAV
jgi:hypothetical protein